MRRPEGPHAIRQVNGTGMRPKTMHRNAHLDFIEALWDNNGGFCGDINDTVSDCEYTFYALLALGALADA